MRFNPPPEACDASPIAVALRKAVQALKALKRYRGESRVVPGATVLAHQLVMLLAQADGEGT